MRLIVTGLEFEEHRALPGWHIARQSTTSSSIFLVRRAISRIDRIRLLSAICAIITNGAVIRLMQIWRQDSLLHLRMKRKLCATGVELLSETLSRGYEHGSAIVMSTLPFDEWTRIADHVGHRDERKLPARLRLGLFSVLQELTARSRR